ncbi:MAG: tRNA (N6-threonylcarbamoyladenosine(37)-N6)-methyltransferase TrmO [Myxococcota bacterium]|nr:tRNA (N6-threonylcarbamoyladenosine(37)-N6)-methyltransferase TrmO [Myxococcota bacterium]
MEPIAIARTPYKERYGTPHQSTALRGTREGAPVDATIELLPHVPLDALRSLEGFDRIWLIYVFHMNEGWSALVRPPRGPRVKRGVLATRSPHRPCPIGLSAVRLVGIEGRALRVHGVDLLDGTPVLDIKPYVPYADAFPDARAGWVDEVDALEAESAGKDRPGESGER